ncbi:MAG: UvrD-helicase domain-containing protein [Thermoleophilia bacterium]
MNLTREQGRIVASGASRVFVSAAAGSGKTRLLVERYLRAVLEEGIPPAQLPTVTFTRKAASEIRQRIRRRLLAEGRPDLAWTLDDAPIGTIHSLCSRLLRSRTLDADVDPTFPVLEEDQSDIVADEAFTKAWDELVLASSAAERVLLARHRSCFRDVRAAYSALRQEGEESPTLRPPLEPAAAAARETLCAVLEDVCGAFGGGGLKGLAARNLEKAEACRLWVPEARPTWEDLGLGATFTPHLGCGAKTKEAFAHMKEALAAFRDALASLYLADVLGLADDLLRRYHAHYRDEKRVRGALDFADLELKARRLLEAGVRPFSAESRLMVDEFQDTNGLQVDILDRLGTARILTVGDPYQSIYAFRGADVQVFRDRHAALLAESAPETLVDSLSVNFRSREPLLRALNHIFGHEAFFGRDFPSLAAPPPPDPSVAPPAVPEGGVGGDSRRVMDSQDPAVEVMVVEVEGPGSVWDAEAAVVAGRVAASIEAGRHPRDVVVLLRAFTHVAEFERAMRSLGVPVYVVQGRGFFAAEEFQDVRALLRLVVNPHDDPALATVLRSPVVGLPDDVALMLRMDAVANDFTYLWEVIRRERFELTAPEYREPLQRVAELLHGLRVRVGSPGLPTLIEDALDAFDYDLVLLGSDDGRRRFANIRKLMRLAADYEALEGPDLGGFLRYLDTRGQLSGDREAGASILSEEDDVVRVMTIHKAKGLEFPVVVVAGMGSAPSTGRDVRSLEVSGDRIGLRVPGPSGKPEDRLVLGCHAEVREEAALKAAEESARLHYVAATRAREHLVLVGATKAGCPPTTRAPLAAVLTALGSPAPPNGGVGVVWPEESLDLVVEWVRMGVVEDARASTDTARHCSGGSPRPAGEGVVETPAFLGSRSRSLGVRQTSFTALHRYEECPRAYYLERVVGLPDHFDGGGTPPSGHFDDEGWRETARAHSDGGGALGRAIGTAVHSVLESVDLRVRPREDEILDLLSVPVRGVAPLGRDARRHAARLSLAFWDSPYADVVARGGALFRERPFRFAHEGVVVSGLMDVVVVGEEGRWVVVDYKTNRLEAVHPGSVFGPYELQSRLYGLASLLGGAAEVEVAFVFLERPSAPVVRTYHGDDVAGLRSALSARLAGLAASEFPKVEAGCSTCGLTTICRLLGD